MLLSDVLGYTRGYVVICAKGLFLERFLNICMRRGIFLRDVKRCGEDTLEASISIDGFRGLRQIAKKTKTTVRIKSRHGLPFLIFRYRRRKFAVIGIAAFVAIIWYLSTHIMGISITGNERLAAVDIERELRASGLYRGAATSKIEPRSVQNKMMTRFDDIAWIGVNIRGSRAYIEVKERLDTKLMGDTSVPCNLVALRDGVVRLLEVKAGQTMVKTNQFVEKGDLLVSGLLDSTSEGIRYAYSFGEVYADTEYQKTRLYPLNYTQKLYSGNECRRRSISAMGKRLDLYLKKSQPFEYCDKEETTAEYSLFGKKLPSVTLITQQFKEYTPQKKTRTVKQAVELGKAELEAELKKEVPSQAKINDVQVMYNRVSEREVSVTVKILCYQDIAVQSAIDKTENMNYNDNNENT